MLAELCGFGMTSDSKDMVNPDIEGPSEAMRLALEDAELAPTDIDYLNAHGTATTINDRNETNAIKKVFGKHAYNLAVSSTKSMHGHPLGAGGGIEAVACIKAHAGQLGAAHHRPRRARPRVRSRLRAERGTGQEGDVRHVELLRLRRPQRRPRVRPSAGLSRDLSSRP